MRRKSERTATKKAKTSPEKKVEKTKRWSRRTKQSTSDNESGDEQSPAKEPEPTIAGDKVEIETAKSDAQEETQDQVWQVKTAEVSGDSGEIQKLKICLTRPPSTPERADRSPRSKRKHSRATSSSDTASVDVTEEKKKSKHRSKRVRESKDDSEKNQDSHGEDIESEPQERDQTIPDSQKEITSETDKVETTVSTTNETNKEPESSSADTSSEVVESQSSKPSDADTTVVSPKDETTDVSQSEATPLEPESSQTQSDVSETQPDTASSTQKDDVVTEKETTSDDKSEVLELHPDDSKIESMDYISKEDDPEESTRLSEQEAKVSNTVEVHMIEEVVDKVKNAKATNDSEFVEKIEGNNKVMRKKSVDSNKDNMRSADTSVPNEESIELEHKDSIQSNHEDIHNGHAPLIHINRKRRWGSRPKLTTQKSITISTDVLKDIIPDVKPAEFEEVIEEKKHKRVEAKEKVERPVLPKIIIDNTENMEFHRKEQEKEIKDRDIVKTKELHMASNRKISIVKDNDSIITRPPSPPKQKQSCILYITNLVRPFTEMQLKNLLQRTGKIVDNGFWMDKIKSKCYVKYESEEHAVETRHALHGVTWPSSNPKTLYVDFSSEEAFEKAKLNENPPTSTIPGTVEAWVKEQDMKREKGEMEKPWERKAAMREWDMGKNEKDKDKEKLRREERPIDKRRNRSPERSPEPARKFKRKEEEAPAKLLDDLFRKTKTTPCIYWLPLSAETIAIKEEQRRQQLAEHERRLQEQRRTHRRH